jgi:hypothetical protein
VEVQQVIEQKQMFIAAGYMMSIFSLVARNCILRQQQQQQW